MKILPFGDAAAYIKFGEDMNSEHQKKIQAMMHKLDTNPFVGYIESVPAYTNLTVYYNPLLVLQHCKGQSAFTTVTIYLEQLLTTLNDVAMPAPRTIEIPVVYGGVFGPDLAEVAHHNNLSPEEVIAIHTSESYLVYMLGFAPGFPFLGGMSEKIATPRKAVPRLKIPAGAVGIAGKQTGIYPLETPGGWQIIGRAATPLFNAADNPPTLLQSGDYVKFVAITEEEAQWH